MDLPIAPTAFDDGARPRADRGADVGAAVGLLVFEAFALLVTFGRWLVTAMSFDPERTATPDRLWGYLVAAGGIGALALVAAVIASRSRAVVTVSTQCFMAVVVGVGVVSGVAVQRHEDRIDRPAPAFSGEVGCRSGGDISECAGSGG
ncbi:DUF6234 family protein [Streptomyces sp. H39-S7]|uniref:DUF6234 family protein n=1 Tax=Streptomyces sp. H39-S7 TaxID=3004357 RepID=UPI0022B03318|nr:DUF6234 family protein [Streptomyces sp. H39-S7]MCZ4126199.1 DUF6234 family protein [Streptomyces sp. H39-S7]